MRISNFGEEKGGVKALGPAKKVRAQMEIVLRLNDRYAEGGAYLALGAAGRTGQGRIFKRLDDSTNLLLSQISEFDEGAETRLVGWNLGGQQPLGIGGSKQVVLEAR